MEILDATPRIGKYEKVSIDGREHSSYVPLDLPFEPTLKFDPRAQVGLQEAYYALGRLEGTTRKLPNPNLLVYMYLRKEAVLSSQIEGAQSSLEDFLKFEETESPGVPRDEIVEISNYVVAMQRGMHLLRKHELTIDLICELHGILLNSGRGSEKSPGKLRDSQVFIGSTHRMVFVPPPAKYVIPKLENLIEFISTGAEPAGILGKAAIVHVQFETIHPFRDGNGRLGRMLITLMLCRAGLLSLPVLIISLFLMQHRKDYYQLLSDVREHGDWEGWLMFFLAGIKETASVAADSIDSVGKLIANDRAKIKELGGKHSNTLLVYENLLSRPISDVPALEETTKLTAPTVRSAFNKLIDLGICSEVSLKQRNRLYRYDAYLDVLNEGTEMV